MSVRSSPSERKLHGPIPVEHIPWGNWSTPPRIQDILQKISMPEEWNYAFRGIPSGLELSILNIQLENNRENSEYIEKYRDTMRYLLDIKNIVLRKLQEMQDEYVRNTPNYKKYIQIGPNRYIQDISPGKELYVELLGEIRACLLDMESVYLKLMGEDAFFQMFRGIHKNYQEAELNRRHKEEIYPE